MVRLNGAKAGRMLLLAGAAAAVGLLGLSQGSAASQRYSTPYQHINTVSGVRFSSKITRGDITPDNQDAVLYKVENTNAYKVKISFDYHVESRTGERKVTGGPSFTLKGGEVQEGTKDGLWTIPFDEDVRVYRAGYKGLKITRSDE